MELYNIFTIILVLLVLFLALRLQASDKRNRLLMEELKKQDHERSKRVIDPKDIAIPAMSLEEVVIMCIVQDLNLVKKCIENPDARMQLQMARGCTVSTDQVLQIAKDKQLYPRGFDKFIPKED